MRIRTGIAPWLGRECYSRRLTRSYRIRTSEHRRAREWQRLRYEVARRHRAMPGRASWFDNADGRTGLHFSLMNSLRRHWPGAMGALVLIGLLCLQALLV